MIFFPESSGSPVCTECVPCRQVFVHRLWENAHLEHFVAHFFQHVVSSWDINADVRHLFDYPVHSLKMFTRCPWGSWQCSCALNWSVISSNGERAKFFFWIVLCIADQEWRCWLSSKNGSGSPSYPMHDPWSPLWPSRQPRRNTPTYWRPTLLSTRISLANKSLMVFAICCPNTIWNKIALCVVPPRRWARGGSAARRAPSGSASPH